VVGKVSGMMRWQVKWKINFCKFWKNAKNSSILDWSGNFTKNQEKYLKINGEIRLKKYCIDF